MNTSLSNKLRLDYFHNWFFFAAWCS